MSKRTRNKNHTELSRIVIDKKIIPLLLKPTLLPEKKKQAKIKVKIEARTKTFSKSLAITAIKRVIISKIISR